MYSTRMFTKIQLFVFMHNIFRMTTKLLLTFYLHTTYVNEI